MSQACEKVAASLNPNLWQMLHWVEAVLSWALFDVGRTKGATESPPEADMVAAEPPPQGRGARRARQGALLSLQ